VNEVSKLRRDNAMNLRRIVGGLVNESLIHNCQINGRMNCGEQKKN
jgi:hypothetical protein